MNKDTRRWMLATLAAASLCGGLTACAPLIVGGAMVTGSMLALDRRTSGAQLEDEGIELRCSSRLHDAVGGRGHINITSYNRQVLVTGEVSTEQDRQLAEQIVLRVENVRGIVNELAVMPVSSLTQRSSDALITGQVKAAFVDARELSANTFKVVTERGVTYLMGRVTQAEAAKATELTRTISGVQKVLRMFEYLSDEEVRQLMVPPQTPHSAPKKP